MIERTYRPIIKFTHFEVAALLRMIDDIEAYQADDKIELNEHEKSAKEKLKKIYARQILSNERKQNVAHNNS